MFIPPEAAQAQQVVELAVLADGAGLDLVTFQDHPYQARFLDTWTLLSHVAARTTNVRLAPNVANLPLRQPVVLARSAATLDLLSHGRVELGLGAGAFWDAIAANGGPRLTPGQGVDALAEAIAIIRGIWDTDRRSVRETGEHYAVTGAHPGPRPAHPIEIWLGAYKPRMLALAGAQADGWLPSMGYIELDAIAPANRAIDQAAEDAGRPPGAVRRLLNINGAFGSGPGFLQGPPDEWAKQLAELTHTSGMSTYILSVTSETDMRRFAEEVVPAVREHIESGRPIEPAPTARTPEATPFAAVPTPDDGRRLSTERPWDESQRPSARLPAPDRRYTPDEQAAGRHLIDVHDHLRAELTQLRDLVAQVARGEADATKARSFINRMTIRQNNWTLGTFCETYCRVVTHHHTLEDRSMFPHLRDSEPALNAVIDRLEAEHETIADLLERVDRSLIGLVASDGDGMRGVQAAVDLLSDALLSHFAYEERELIEPLARHSFH